MGDTWLGGAVAFSWDALAGRAGSTWARQTLLGESQRWGLLGVYRMHVAAA